MYTRTSYSSSHETNITRDLKVKAKEVDLYSAFVVVPHTEGVQLRITQCYLQITIYLPPPHKRSPDGASPDWGCGHLIAAYTQLSTPKGWKAKSAWLAGLQRTVYPHKWSSVSRRSIAGQRKFACQRPTFYHCATQPTKTRAHANRCKLINMDGRMLLTRSRSASL